MDRVKLLQKAPDFTLPTVSGEQFKLSDVIGKKNVVLFFYPKDHTPLCTAQACAFRDAYEKFVEEGAEVVGISADRPEQHQHFAKKHALPFVLLSDADGEVSELYAVRKTMGLIPGRVTFVIDKEGTIRSIFNAQFAAARHVEEALKTLRQT